MSLLMDALRRAEADKKQASAAISDTDDFTLSETTEIPVAPTDLDVSAISARQDAPIPPQPPALELEPFESQGAVPAGAAVDTDLTDATLVAPSVQRYTTPNPAGTENQLGSSFEDSRPRQSINSDLLAAGHGSRATNSGITETIATANTVFEAGTEGPSKRMVLWGSVAVIVVACVFTGVGIYFFQTAPIAIQIPSPSVASDVEKSPPRAAPIIAPDSTLKSPAPTLVTIGDEAGLDPLIAPGVVEADLIAGKIKQENHSAAFSNYPVPELDVIASEQYPESDDPDEGFGSTEITAPQSSPPAVIVGIRPGEVRIARSPGASNTDEITRQAYAVYTAGEYLRSEELYQAVLSQKPEHRDALLGVAALKLRVGDVAAAHRLYRAVLKRDPENPTANAAMFSLEGGQGGQVTESRLKMLLDEGVDVEYVYFSLGNLYARNRRWADAQQAYFEALHNSPTNPDYNYNLAVSLDRIGQRAAAVKYYDAAISYTDSQQAGFDPALALARIQNIGREPSP